jgi:leucyl-tRNA synthetase
MVTKFSEKTGKLEKMSKSKGNVINPDNLVKKYGTDTVRLYELFIGPPDVDSEWNDSGIEGCYRFLKKAWDFVIEQTEKDYIETDCLSKRKLHQLIKKITDRIEEFKLNTAISAFMEFIKDVSVTANFSKQDIEKFAILLSPFAPHFAEEVWCGILGHCETIFNARWPEFDITIISEESVIVPVQVDGKLRGTIIIEKEEDFQSVLKKALELNSVSKFLSDKKIAKQIYIPGRIVNFVTEK